MDKRITDIDPWLFDRRLEAERMIALWSRSTKIYARQEIAYWRKKLEKIDAGLARPSDWKNDDRE